MRKVMMLAVALPSLLAGCDLPQLNLPVLAVAPNAYHTVSYYDAHPMERDQTNAWCNDNAGMATKIPTCGNADQAGINAFNRKMGFLK